MRNHAVSPSVGAGRDRPAVPWVPSHRRTQACGRRSGITLLEVMVAIVLTSIVVAVAYAMAQAGIDARTRLTDHLRATQSARAAREILRDALRNARAAQTAGDPRGGIVLSNDTLSFVAATALGHAQPATVTFRIPEVTRWTVWLLAPDGHSWRTDWTEPVLMPRAVVVGLWNGNHLSGLPLHVSLWPGASPVVADSLPVLSATQ